MDKTHRSHEEATSAMFRADPALAVEYLNDVLQTGDEVDLMLALRSLGEAYGGIQKVARGAGSNPNALSTAEAPSLNTLRTVLNAMGLRLAIQPLG